MPDMLDLFRRTAATVPAYQDFLRSHGVDPDSVRALADIPLMTKENYHTRYPLPRRCRDGRLAAADTIAVSSGSTGKPTYWPRTAADEQAATARFEQIFRHSFGAADKATLAVICFPLGTWVGGLYTTSCCQHLAGRGYPITVVAAGNDKAEILRVVPELAPAFDQTVLLGYPPFLKDVIDTGLASGVDWTPMRIKLVMAGEVFSEDWRDLVGSRAGMTRPAHDSAALYGTADAGVLGCETPLTITIRRFLASDPDLAQVLTGQRRLPTLVQYDPADRYFEALDDGTLAFSADGGVPLVRYHIADEGGVLGYEQLLSFCADHGLDLGADADLVAGSPALPFVYVFGRTRFAVSFFGANVYPENIAAGLEQPRVSGWVTGKFVLEVAEDADRNRHLAVAVELAPGEEPGHDNTSQDNTGRTELAADAILGQLLLLNSEFAHYVPAAYQQPVVTLLPAGDPDYFPRGVKHRYTRQPADQQPAH